MIGVITSALIVGSVSVLVPLILSFAYRARIKEEKKNYAKFEGEARTRMAKWQNVVIIVVIAFIAVGMLAIALFAAFEREYEIAAGVTFVNVLYTGLLTTVYIWCNLRYEIATDDRLILVRKFGKKRIEYFFGKDILYYGAMMQGYMSSLTMYDAYGIPLAQISSLRVGVSAIARKLQNSTARAVMPNFPPPQARTTPHYKQYKTKNTRKTALVLCFTIGICMALISFIMFFANQKVPVYQNEKIAGTVESVEYSGDTVKIKLAGDESKYYVNNIVYEKFDVEMFKRWFPEKDSFVADGEITLWVAYTDDSERKNLSQIEFNGQRVLSASAAEQAERDNYFLGKVTNIVFAVLGGGGLLAGVALVAIFRKKRLMPLPDEQPSPVLESYVIRSVPISPFEDDCVSNANEPNKVECANPFGDDYISVASEPSENKPDEPAEPEPEDGE